MLYRSALFAAATKLAPFEATHDTGAIDVVVSDVFEIPGVALLSLEHKVPIVGTLLGDLSILRREIPARLTAPIVE
jgi:hypothetical protein